jgi:glycine betaine/choline ABC-type transport system substrate-binding protein
LIILLLITLLLLAAGIITTHEKTASARLVVASKPTSEQYILGEMAALLIEENTVLSVERKFGMGGGASAIHPAIVNKEIHIYPEYSGTAWLYVLKRPTETARSDFFPELEKVYRDSFGLLWTGRLGFNNTFTLALPEETAREFDIETYSDLAAYSDKLIFGAEFDFFEREDGYPGLLNYYDFRFLKIEELDINLKYEALKNERVDVINAFSTDSRIRAFNLRVLEDDKDFFPEYEAGYVINESTAKEYPEVMEWLERLSGRISNTDMTALNYRVEIENQTTQKVARDFLIKQGLINEKGE